MIFHCRENHEDLEETSIESEVFDIDLDDGASEGDDENEGAGNWLAKIWLLLMVLQHL